MEQNTEYLRPFVRLNIDLSGEMGLGLGNRQLIAVAVIADC